MPAALLLCLSSVSIAAPAPAPPPTPLRAFVDDADDQYHFIVGLAEKDLHDMVVREASAFLAKYANHGRARLVRWAYPEAPCVAMARARMQPAG